MMFVRLALEDDLQAVLDLGRAHCDETMSGDVFSPTRVEEIFRASVATADPTIFVVEDEGKVVGFLLASIHPYDHKDGFFTMQRVVFVQKDKRRTPAGALLIEHLVEWSRRLGADEVFGGNGNGHESDRVAAFLERQGFEKVGYSLAIRLKG